ncbi:MAG: cold-shock protein [Candidatus Marinimicrobia bacterium]|nr:cold-shock protein [Candidatus Neomarinimicrobiota bacterium]MBL7023718.1 cold-shock protein [Candidatus Neomarinimicrobiota bacterium]MBL7109499.1 cold-shock protein [Candidatus Neomarinimicrobiota bacterium]
MKTGIVKTWDRRKGWGFIQDDDGWDYFLNISNIRKGQAIHEGDRVKFDVFEGQRGPSAENVTKM